MNTVKNHFNAKNIATTLLAMTMGVMLAGFPVLVFKSLEHSSLNQPMYKIK